MTDVDVQTPLEVYQELIGEQSADAGRCVAGVCLGCCDEGESGWRCTQELFVE